MQRLLLHEVLRRCSPVFEGDDGEAFGRAESVGLLVHVQVGTVYYFPRERSWQRGTLQCHYWLEIQYILLAALYYEKLTKHTHQIIAREEIRGQ
jgi:hypothetical protein